MRYFTVIVFFLLVVSRGVYAHGAPFDRRKNDQEVERTIAADSRVMVSACVVSGSLTVHSWDRNEVRARATDGRPIELARTDQTKAEQATELQLTGYGRHGTSANSSCVPFGDIELDVPRAASLKLQTSNGDIRVTEVARVNASSQSGSITLAKVHGEVRASTISGEISVRDSSGSFKLRAIGGTIDAHGLSPATPSDAFAASTVGGEVVLAHVQHQSINVNTISGEVNYAGGLARGGGCYNFQSISGHLRLSLPSDSSFRLTAALGEAVKMTSDFNLKYSDNQNLSGVSNRGAFRRIDAIVGNADSSIKVSLLSGSLQITKR